MHATIVYGPQTAGELTFRVPFNPNTLELVERRTLADVRDSRLFIASCRTLENAWKRCDRSDWLLHLLDDAFQRHVLSAQPKQVQLRHFACWAAREWQPTGTQLDLILEAAERACDGHVTIQRLDAIRRSTHPAASSAAGTGIPRCQVNAAAMLAAWHSANPDAFSAAIWSARFAVLAQAFTVAQSNKQRFAWPPSGAAKWLQSFHARCYAEANPDVIIAAERAEQKRQAKVLRFMVLYPFAAARTTRYRTPKT